MKRRIVKTVHLILAVLLAFCLAIPALAAAGTDTLKGHPCQRSVTRTDTAGVASIKTTGAPTTLGAAVKNYVFCEQHRAVGFSVSTGSSTINLVPVTGYAYVSATANNQFKDSSGVPHTGVVQQTNGSFWVNGECVLEGVVET